CCGSKRLLNKTNTNFSYFLLLAFIKFHIRVLQKTLMKKEEVPAFSSASIISLSYNIPITIATVGFGVGSVFISDQLSYITEKNALCDVELMKPFAYATATFDLLMGCLCCVGLTYGLASDLETLEYVCLRVIHFIRALYMVPVLSVMIAWTVIFFKSDCSMYGDLNLDIKVYFICYWIFFGLSAISSFIGYSFAKGSTTIHLKSKSRTQLQTDATLNVDHNL
ncbi:hypothetical protein AKO1_005467, partial [Acrasis kona]